MMNNYCRFSVMLMLTVSMLVFSAAASGQRYGVITLGVGDYPGNDADLVVTDTRDFVNAITATSWFGLGSPSPYFHAGDFKDSQVTAAHFTPPRQTDFIYFAGHGYHGYACLADWSPVGPTQIGQVSTVRNYIFASCYTVNTSWARSFGKGLVTACGYREPTFDGIANRVAKKMGRRVRNLSPTDSAGLIRAWRESNHLLFTDMKTRWTVVARGSDNRIYYYYQEGSQAIGRGSELFRNSGANVEKSAVSASFADGAVISRLKPDRDYSIIAGADMDYRRHSSIMDATESVRPLRLGAVDKEQSDRGAPPTRTGEAAYSGTDARMSYPSGAVFHRISDSRTRGFDFAERISINMDQAFEKAYEFVMNNDGLPADASLYAMDAIHRVDVESGKQETVGYAVTWLRNHEGRPFSGISGDAISVVLENDRVSEYYRLWRPVLGPLDADADDFRSGADDASESDFHLLSAQQAVEAAATAIASAARQNVEIVDARLGYHSEDYETVQAIAKPAWHLVLSDGMILQVDAETGDLLM